MAHRYKVGDKVVYTRDKYTPRPGPRAKNVFASPNGEAYQYQVEKYWIVADVRPDGFILLKTRRGKNHLVATDDPRLRKASLFDRLWKSHLFPAAALLKGGLPLENGPQSNLA
jgi:hypothetical protein